VLFLPEDITVLTSRETKMLWNFPSLVAGLFVACRLRDIFFF
jgi:hypothetical protein